MYIQIDCPNCQGSHTFHTPETVYERFCVNCDAVWDIRWSQELDYV